VYDLPDSPNAGDHSVKAPLNIGVDDPARAPYLPVYTLRNLSTQATIHTTDPGRAMLTGKWADIGKFKGPILRALAARAPFFHNGSAATLDEVVDFYDTRFNIGLTAAEKADCSRFSARSDGVHFLKRYPTIDFTIQCSLVSVIPRPTPKLISQSGDTFRSATPKTMWCSSPNGSKWRTVPVSM
jgi:Cytochrome c peroxidase